jgi:hypothetical protein
MVRQHLVSIFCLLVAACGEPAKTADDADVSGEGEGEGEGEGATKPKDNIVRDADGDGQPDDAAAKCDGMPETRCKITATCAWTDSGTCVDAKGGM